MKHIFRAFLLLIIAAALAYYFGWFNKILSSSSNEEEKHVSDSYYSQSIPVDVLVLKPESIENKVNSTGTLLPREAVSIRSEISGRVTSINFKEGQRVNKNDLLLELNRTELLAELKRLDPIIAFGIDREKRYQGLLKQDIISYEDYEAIKLELDLAVNDANIIKAKLEKTYVLAPFDGVLGFRRVSPGTYLSPDVEITQLLNIDTVLLEFSVPGKYSKSIRLGNTISYTTQNSDHVRKGMIYVKEPFIDGETRMLTARAFTDNRSQALIPGQFVNISLVIDSYNDAILVPAEAVIPGKAGNSVFVVHNGIAESRPVEVGTRTDKRIHILSGINGGDSLIITGLLRVFPGASLDIKRSN